MNALKIDKGTSSKSAYNIRSIHGTDEERHTLAVIVANEPGVLARVTVSYTHLTLPTRDLV